VGATVPDHAENALEAARMAGAKFVYFDNTYMYAQSNAPQTEETRFARAAEKEKCGLRWQTECLMR
jgi:hypothetical protein